MRKQMVGMLGAAALLAGCGATDRHSADRPPAQVNLAVNVTNARVSISPSHIGAGPAVITVSNTSSRLSDLTLVAAPDDGGRPCVEQQASSGPISPQGTARLPVQLVAGDCILRVEREDGIRPARLTVTGERETAQSDLNVP